MGEDLIVTLGSIILGIVVVGGALWLSLRSPAKKTKPHATRARITARRDNDRNTPPDTF
jgi:hypothetical protein